MQAHFQALSLLFGVSSFAALVGSRLERQSSKLEKVQGQVTNQRELQVQVAANKEIAEVIAAAADAATQTNKEQQQYLHFFFHQDDTPQETHTHTAAVVVAAAAKTADS